MRIFDKDNNEIQNPDLSLGYLLEDKILIAHHEAVEAVAEKGHWAVVAEYPNGGKDVAWVVDVPGVEAKEAWDEFEEIHRFVLYTAEELSRIAELRSKPSADERLAKLEKAMESLPTLIQNAIKAALAK